MTDKFARRHGPGATFQIGFGDPEGDRPLVDEGLPGVEDGVLRVIDMGGL
jgi:hypothetical protein